MGDVNIVVTGVSDGNRPAVGIAIDSNSTRGYLYTGDFIEEGAGNAHLVRTKLSDHNSIEITVGDNNSVIGVDVDKDTGLVYCTTTSRDFRVYDSNLVEQQRITGLGRFIPSWPDGYYTGPAGLAVGGCFVPPVVRINNNDPNYGTIGDAISHAVSGDTIVAWPGTYKENVYFDNNKLLTLQSTDPNDPFIVAQTVISCINDYSYQYNTITFTNNNSTINGFTIVNSNYYGVYCSGGGPTIKNCYIRNNGWGLYCDSSSASTIANCIIKNNLNRGISCSSAGQVKITNNWIVNNSSYGVYVFNTNNEVTVRNNTISGNNSGGIYRSGGTAEPNISNSIFWYNGSNHTTDFVGTFTKVNYCRISAERPGSSTGNILSDPCFVDDVNVGDYHLKSASLCRNNGDPNTTLDIKETDIDGQPRRNGTARPVDIGADEFYNSTNLNGDGQVNFLDYAIFAAAWRTYPSNPKWNAACDFIDNNNIDINDLAWFAQDWPFPPPTEPQAPAPGQEPPPPIYLAYEGSMTPDPNTEVTVYVYSDITLSSMDMFVTVTGDANITTAMSTIDCNQYGWDSEWSWDPYIDPNGWVEFGGISLAGQATGTVGYFKFIYNSGEVTVSITADSYAYDANSQPATFSTDPLIFGGEGMQGSQQQSMMQSSLFEESAAMDSPPVDVNDLADQLEKIWLEDAELRATITQAQWQQFIDSIKSSQ